MGEGSVLVGASHKVNEKHRNGRWGVECLGQMRVVVGQKGVFGDLGDAPWRCDEHGGRCMCCGGKCGVEGKTESSRGAEGKGGELWGRGRE